MHACAHVCHGVCLYMCDIHLSRAQLPLCLLQLRGLLLSLVLHLHQEVILVVFVELHADVTESWSCHTYISMSLTTLCMYCMCMEHLDVMS